MKRKILGTLLFVCMIFSLLGCGVTDDVKDQVENVVDSLDEHVLGVKNGHPSSYPDKTYGEAFEAFFALPTWKYFVGTQEGLDDDGDGEPDYTNDNVDVVEFTGYCTYQDVEVKALLQFVLSKEDDTFEATYLSFNDVPQSSLIMYALLDKVFTDEESSSENINTESSKTDTPSDNNEYEYLQAFIDCICLYSDPPDLEGDELDQYFKGEYNIWMSGDGYTNVVLNADGSCSYYDYYNIYGNILDDFVFNYGEYTEYTIFDLDSDGIKELIVSYGDSSADWANDVYSYSESGALYCGTFYLPVSFYASDDGNGMYTVYEHMDTQIIMKIELKGTKITEVEISDNNFPSDNYIPVLNATDYSLLY